MAKAYGSIIVDAPVEAVWAVVRDFNGLPNWLPGVASSGIDNGRHPAEVGCLRRLMLGNGASCSERLLALDDSRYMVSYGFVDQLFPISNHRAVIELIPITADDRCFVQWSADFEEAPGHAGEIVAIMEREVFAAGLAALQAKLAGAKAPDGAVRWDGWRPAKVFCSSEIDGSADAVWARIRDFAGMGAWHPDISGMHMMQGAKPDQLGGVRDFQFGEGRILERLTYLSDPERAFRYTIEASPMPWLHYHSGVRLYPVTATGTCVGVWVADWVASPNDDVRLIPDIHQDVFQKAFDTLNERHFPR
jgi:hypothetical protein